MRFQLSRIFMVVLLSVFLMYSESVLAQTYPTKPITLIIPFSIGGGNDVIFRILQPGLSENLGQQFIIDNRPGGGATIGMNMVVKSAPDGYTLGCATTSFAANPCLMSKMPFDTEKDLVPVSLVEAFPLVLAVHSSVPARSLKELIALAKAKPGSLSYASAGNASTSHLMTELLKHTAGIDMVHVPYKGGGPQVISAVSGETQLLFTGTATSIQHMKSGKWALLAITSAKRNPLLPDVPTMAEAGLPGFEVVEWGGIVAPTGTPRAVVDRLHQAVVKTLARPEVKERLEKIGTILIGSTPEELGTYIKNEIARWCKMVKAVGIRYDQ
jgi:tripartite-type tricarboxylate transporter receptor subunit TctC